MFTVSQVIHEKSQLAIEGANVGAEDGSGVGAAEGASDGSGVGRGVGSGDGGSVGN